MKIRLFYFAAMTCLLASCGGKVTKEETVLASRSADSIKAEWLKPHDAILRIRLDSETPVDVLTRLDFKYGVEDDHYEAINRPDQMLTHPYERDFVVIPTGSHTELEFRAVVSDSFYTARTIIPHLWVDTRTQINLNLAKGQLRVVSSWIEECQGEVSEAVSKPDTIMVGHYLSLDGTIHEDYVPTSVAVVVETDGRHGKAVALTDVDGEWVFSYGGCSSGQVFKTLEGRAVEGILDKRRTEADSLGLLFYSPGLPYPDGCAFAHNQGYRLCESLSERAGDLSSPADMMRTVSLKSGAYVPSAAEMAGLYNLIMGNGSRPFSCRHLTALSGGYLTSSESSEDTVYSMDFTQGALTGHTSKRFTPLHVRLFYLF